ncbi:spore coat associated protein CotJA [Natroniella acetigena]|uniref:spore coat associated protein CotJA n=1 Tax=Natroniella acetigena TaxID=52004 RepID=UPI00200A62F1|nr:spore coat associated protein CotJA [Natroniella acetigena]MCK8828285.1 spore coat associated protein CotJA [Natroniella acetigena]
MAPDREFLENSRHLELRLAEAYVPFQTYQEHYSPLEGLKQGTSFPELDIPYVRRR